MSDHPALTRPVAPSPNHRNLYLLILGLVGGIALGPAVLGRLSPDSYQKIFGVGRLSHAQLKQISNEKRDQINRLTETGVTASAVKEQLAQAQRQRSERSRILQQEHLNWLGALTTAMILAIIIIMVLETMVSPVQPGLAPGLATTRYALTAVWFGITLAQPGLLLGVSGLFVLLLVIVSLLAAFMPLCRIEI